MVQRIFRKVPPDELILRILECVGIVSFQDFHWWPYSLLSVQTICQKLDSLLPELEEYYMPHKTEIIKREMTSRRYVTILRHVIKIKGMNLQGHEAKSSNRGYAARMMYRLVNTLPEKKEVVKIGQREDAIFTVLFN